MAERRSWMEFSVFSRFFIWGLEGIVRIMRAPMIDFLYTHTKTLKLRLIRFYETKFFFVFIHDISTKIGFGKGHNGFYPCKQHYIKTESN